VVRGDRLPHPHGHITDDKRQEFILLSDVLGLSMLVVGINNRRPPEATESTVFGPFFVEGSPAFENGDDIAQGAPGEPCLMQGRVRRRRRRAGRRRAHRGLAGRRGRLLRRPVRRPRPRRAAAATSPRRDDGRYWFWSVKPEAYPIPADGPVGELLEAGGRGPMRPAHVHFMVTAEGYQTLITHVFVEGDEHLDSDAVFGVRALDNFNKEVGRVHSTL
jgi:hydroxyquinol 1,2-dioxygenase